MCRSEEDNSIEAAEAKDVWCRGGLTFESSGEGEALARLVEKLKKKKWPDFRPKKRKQGRKTALYSRKDSCYKDTE
ncbi:hypothetical protein PIB30_081282, partial [Stylosanthes scabra]|nr:hypothetical protein [Stylosanthes scabra]